MHIKIFLLLMGGGEVGKIKKYKNCATQIEILFESNEFFIFQTEDIYLYNKFWLSTKETCSVNKSITYDSLAGGTKNILQWVKTLRS